MISDLGSRDCAGAPYEDHGGEREERDLADRAGDLRRRALPESTCDPDDLEHERAGDQERRDPVEADPLGERPHAAASSSRQPAADRGAGEREEDVGDPVDPDHVGLDADREHRNPGGAEPGRAPPEAGEDGDQPGDERDEPDEPVSTPSSV